MESDPEVTSGGAESENRLLVQDYISGKIEYITESLLDRQFELQVKKDLVDAYQSMKNNKTEKRKYMKTTQLSFPNEFLNMKLCDVTKDLGNPKTTRELFQRLDEFSQEYSKRDSQSSCERDEEKYNGSSQFSLPPKFPSSKQGFVTPKFQTPQFQKIFTFGSALTTKEVPQSANKLPRPAKPGEKLFMFSATGSPVVSEATTGFRFNGIPPSESARVKVDDGNGNVIDVDLVFRNASAAQRNKIVTDFRCMTRTCSAASKKLQPHRAIQKKTAGGSVKKF